MSKSARSYQREIKRLREMVSSMLWVQPTYNGSPSCAFCGVQQHQHSEHCDASALVAKHWPLEDTIRQRAVKEG